MDLATGDFITTHDADDWSHPEKIKIQASSLVNAPEILANHTDWARSRANLSFTGSFRPTQTLVQPSLPSTLYRREVFERIGKWDDVRVAADDELIWRVKRYGGPQSIERVLRGLPLAFSLNHDNSLTQFVPTHVRTVFYGVRREYCEAAFHWHSSSPPDKIRLDPELPRPFPSPASILSKPNGQLDCDLILVGDLSFGSSALSPTINYINLSETVGLKMGVFHWPQFNRDYPSRLAPQLRQMAQDGKISVVAPGENARTGLLMVIGPVVLCHAIDLCPKIEFDNLVVLVDGETIRMKRDMGYDPLVARETLLELFGAEGTWIPTSDAVRKGMKADLRYPAPYRDVWTPLVHSSPLVGRPHRSRGIVPVIGRQGSSYDADWPSSLEDLRAAYCVDKRCQVAIRGDASIPLELLGMRPANWMISEGDVGARTFLSKLDFYVYYPQGSQVEQLDCTLLQAMALGCPVILPPNFRDTFGTAAYYAEAAMVWPSIEMLWRTENVYFSQARAGRDFAESHGHGRQFSMRLHRLITGARTNKHPGYTNKHPGQKTNMLLRRDTFQEFIDDIEPYFYGKKVIYVDVGSFDGEVFKQFLGSKLDVVEAHLFEPNPAAFEKLKKLPQSLLKTQSLHVYNIAVGSTSCKVLMKDAKKMTRVLSKAPSEPASGRADINAFTANGRTLDEFGLVLLTVTYPF